MLIIYINGHKYAKRYYKPKYHTISYALGEAGFFGSTIWTNKSFMGTVRKSESSLVSPLNLPKIKSPFL